MLGRKGLRIEDALALVAVEGDECLFLFLVLGLHPSTTITIPRDLPRPMIAPAISASKPGEEMKLRSIFSLSIGRLRR
ncbi:MAG: hypothetical protein JG765_2647 [Cereibacter sp.]|jgi:hypothetical protein|nr:hypothetical protein [Cereibacter sp.]